MLNILYVLTIIAMLAVVATLIMGAASMGGNKDGSRLKSNKWMARRVYAQIIAIALIFLTVYVRKNSGG